MKSLAFTNYQILKIKCYTLEKYLLYFASADRHVCCTLRVKTGMFAVLCECRYAYLRYFTSPDRHMY